MTGSSRWNAGLHRGTLLAPHGKGSQVIDRMAHDLQLIRPLASWHTQRDEWVALGCELGLMVGSLGKIAKDLARMSQFEVAEPAEPGRGGPSNVPHKHNPVARRVAIAAAQRAPQRVAALLAAMPQEYERVLGAWQVELAEWPLLVMCSHGCVRALAQALPGLTVDVTRMRANLDAMRASLPRSTDNGWFDSALAQHAGELALAQAAQLRQDLDQLGKPRGPGVDAPRPLAHDGQAISRVSRFGAT